MNRIICECELYFLVFRYDVYNVGFSFCVLCACVCSVTTFGILKVSLSVFIIRITSNPTETTTLTNYEGRNTRTRLAPVAFSITA